MQWQRTKRIYGLKLRFSKKATKFDLIFQLDFMCNGLSKYTSDGP